VRVFVVKNNFDIYCKWVLGLNNSSLFDIELVDVSFGVKKIFFELYHLYSFG